MADKSIPSVYLAGPIKEADDGGHGWRSTLTASVSTDRFDLINPLDHIDGGDESTIEATDEEIVELDLQLISESDGVLVCYTDLTMSMGTPMEIVYAVREYGIPVAVAWQCESSVSPWIQTHASFVSHDVHCCLDYLEQSIGDRTEPVSYDTDGVSFFNPSDTTTGTDLP